MLHLIEVYSLCEDRHIYLLQKLFQVSSALNHLVDSKNPAASQKLARIDQDQMFAR